ncbi:MAG: alpha/beta fold hydrolase [Balneolaceae bacterium]
MNIALPGFSSAPWCFNGHAHTILCSQLFKPVPLPFSRRSVPTPDGDFLNIDLLHADPSAPFVVLLHGLEGSTGRYYMRNLAHHLWQLGFNIAAVNFRSCGGELNKTRRFYHSGEYKDIATVCSWLDSSYKRPLQFAVGFSLGGSALLNYLHHKKNKSRIRMFSAVSVPYDLYRGSVNLQKGFNRIYDYNFLLSLKQKLAGKRERFPDLPEFTGSTLFDFDDQITGPIHGFSGAEEYYRVCSSANFMDQIQTPGLLIHSREDPLCPFAYTPVKDILANPLLSTSFTDRGGHVGFWSLPPGWLNRTIASYFIHQAAENDFFPGGTIETATQEDRQSE